MTIKRPNYATGQLLTATDFQNEQDYHRNYRLWHNRSLHTPGVASGLEFSASADLTKAMVSPGYAIDASGQELVVLEQATFDVSGSAFGTRLAVVLRYSDVQPDPVDDVQIGGVKVSTRTSERTTLELVPATYPGANNSEYTMPPLNGAICIGVIRCSRGTLLGGTASFDLIYRQKAGSKVGGTLPMPLGIGVAAPQAGLAVNANIGAVGNGSFGGAAIAFGNTGSDPTQFVQGNNDGYVSFGWGFNSAHAQINTSSAAPLALQEGPGNVGIGTASPQEKLHVAGNFLLVDGAGGEKVYLGGDGNPYSPGVAPGSSAAAPTKLDVQLGSTNSVVSTVTLYNRSSSTGFLMDLACHYMYGTKVGYVVDQFVNASGDRLDIGDVVVIGSNQATLTYGSHGVPVPEVDLTTTAYDTRVCGIVSDTSSRNPHLLKSTADSEKSSPRSRSKKGASASSHAHAAQSLSAEDRNQMSTGQTGHMATLGAFAHCKVDADIAAIEIGDLLTTSPTPGHAQKVLDRSQAIGAIIGKALAPLKKGKGKIPVMVVMQ